MNSCVLRNSIPFSFHREEEELEELKEQNWELPLQDGEGCWTPGCLLRPRVDRLGGHGTSLTRRLVSRTAVPDLPRSRAVRGAVGRR